MYIYNRARTFSLLVILSVAVTISISSVPSAIAFPDPLHKVSEPSVILSGESITLIIEVSDPPLEHMGESIRVWNPLNTPTFVDSCPLPGDSNGGKVWELRDDFNPTQVVKYKIPAVEGAKIQVEFGSGETVEIIPSGGATVDGSTSSKLVRWVEINDGLFSPSDDTLQGGPYQFTSCGTEGDIPYGGEGATFEAENPVAGFELPIDYYSLVLAGIYSNYSIFLPVLAGISATAFTIFKIKGSKIKIF